VPKLVSHSERKVSPASTRSRHPALGWRLRIELGTTLRFGFIFSAGDDEQLFGSGSRRTATEDYDQRPF
jgi:hypothetical protein